MVSYVVILLFVGMIGYLAYFMYHDADGYRNNSYNAKRQELLAGKFTRGTIEASDGSVLAKTEVDEDGKETRVYPYGKAFCHVVGYSTRGVSGIESQAGSYLLSTHANLVFRVVEDLRGVKSVGDTVRTTLDAKLQEIVYDAMDDYAGAAVVMEPDTGKVLAMVSQPTFNPNTLAEDWEDLVSEDNDKGNLVNRATQGLYTPGSIFKILTVLEYIREYPDSWQDYEFDCSGSYTVDGYTINCSKKTKHGKQNLTEAFANSCNGAFAEIGQMLSFSHFYELCEEVGFNQAAQGIPANTSSFTLNNNDSLWNILQTSIGQGETQVTPLFAAMLASAVANDGVMMTPYLLDSVTTRYGDKVASFAPRALRQAISGEEAEILKTMMEAVVKDGTGSAADGAGYTVAGKTGSAETRKDTETNAWFIGYAYSDEAPDHKIAVAIVLQEAGGGGSAAAPVARRIFQEYFNNNFDD